MNRRSFLGHAAVALVLSAARSSAQASDAKMQPLAKDHPLQDSWKAWKSVCLLPDGRVVDGFQNSDSHSEGQSYGLLLAWLFQDTSAFGAIVAWTEGNLAIRDDALLAWRWKPDAMPHIDDRNNASDGDLFYAWALALAGQQHDRRDLTDRARAIVSDLVKLCVVDHPDGSGRPLFLPGAAGFQTADGYVLNPSYYMPRAMLDLATLTGIARLSDVSAAGQQIIDALAGRGLVPDWVSVGPAGTAPPPDRFSARSGYDAIRVPLFDLWSGRSDAPAVRRFEAAAAAAGTTGGAVTVFDAATGNPIERSSHPGYLAIAELAACVGGNGVGSLMPGFSKDQPYYPATLQLMALVVQATAFSRCVPI